MGPRWSWTQARTAAASPSPLRFQRLEKLRGGIEIRLPVDGGGEVVAGIGGAEIPGLIACGPQTPDELLGVGSARPGSIQPLDDEHGMMDQRHVRKRRYAVQESAHVGVLDVAELREALGALGGGRVADEVDQIGDAG